MRASCEGLAKALYQLLFLYLVKSISASLSGISDSYMHYVGILDIAGFENFPSNSFEQFCINLTNERLQQLFNKCMFDDEQVRSYMHLCMYVHMYKHVYMDVLVYACMHVCMFVYVCVCSCDCMSRKNNSKQ